MKIEASYFKSLDAFLSSKQSTQKEYFLLVAQQTTIKHEKLLQSNLAITGAFFPEIIFEKKLYDEGLIALEINSHMQLFFEKDMQKIEFRKMALKNTPSVITIVDGVSKFNETYLNELFKHTGVKTTILGAGAGSLDMKNEKVFFDKQGFYTNCAVLILLENRINLGVKHGWQLLEGPYVVTSSKENVLKEIDYKNAYEVYKEVIEKDMGQSLSDEAFEQQTQNYPLGIIKYQGEQLVRDIIQIKDKELFLAGNMTENTVINILKGDCEALLKATNEASQEALTNKCEFIFMFDCFTRKTFLKDKFEEELDIIFHKKETLSVMGAISIGEVANNGKNYISFFNKTCVIGGVCF